MRWIARLLIRPKSLANPGKCFQIKPMCNHNLQLQSISAYTTRNQKLDKLLINEKVAMTRKAKEDLRPLVNR